MTKVRLILHFETSSWDTTMKDYMLSERLQNTFKNSTVCVLDKTSYLGLHSPRKNLLTDVLHKYKKALFSISILSIFKCFYFVDVSPN